MTKIFVMLLVIVSGSLAEGFERDDAKKYVLDTKTKLQWQDNIEATTIKKNYEDSIAYCDELVLGGYDDWRLPFGGEMNSIVMSDNAPMYPASFKNVVPDQRFNKYWTLSLWENSKYASIAGCIDFNKGSNNDFCSYGKDEKFLVRCVRGEQLDKSLKIEDYYEKDGATKRAFKNAFDEVFQHNDFTKLDLFLKDDNHKRYINMLYNGYLPIQIAGIRESIIKYLISHGADISLKDFRGYTPLMSIMRNPCRRFGEVVPCETLDYNPKKDIGLIRLLGGDENTKPFVEPATIEVEGKLWEYKTSKAIEGKSKHFNQASKHCESLHLDNKDFRVPKCKELGKLSSNQKTVPFVLNGIRYSNGVYIDFFKTPDLDPNFSFWCIDDSSNTALYNFVNKKITSVSSESQKWMSGKIKCIQK